MYQRQKILLVDLTFKNGLGLKENNRQLFNKIHFYTYSAIFSFFFVKRVEQNFSAQCGVIMLYVLLFSGIYVV